VDTRRPTVRSLSEDVVKDESNGLTFGLLASRGDAYGECGSDTRRCSGAKELAAVRLKLDRLDLDLSLGLLPPAAVPRARSERLLEADEVDAGVTFGDRNLADADEAGESPPLRFADFRRAIRAGERGVAGFEALTLSGWYRRRKVMTSVAAMVGEVRPDAALALELE